MQAVASPSGLMFPSGSCEGGWLPGEYVQESMARSERPLLLEAPAGRPFFSRYCAGESSALLNEEHQVWIHLHPGPPSGG